ncbi:MAG: TonB-dependent receptor [Endomicrobium sp.]|jgi:hypothetical protein|nr:TonB-dependent receptor [Endomicrobium sp.]
MKKITALLFSFCICASAAFAQENDSYVENSDKQSIFKFLDFSVTGSLLAIMDDVSGSRNRGKAVLSLGELELMMEANLNPYASATVVLGLHDQEAVHDEHHGDDHEHPAIEIEEAYISIFQNLPVDRLALKAGKYRVGYGRLNKEHPHVYPFISMPKIIGNFLPGEHEGYKDLGAEISYMIPSFFGGASLASFNILSGEQFHPAHPENHVKSEYAYMLRLNNSFLIAQKHPFEIGFSYLRNTSSIEYEKYGNLYGFDIKTKFDLSPSFSLLLQGEAFINNGTLVTVTENPVPPDTIDFYDDNRYGFYAFANAYLGKRWNMGFVYDQYQRQYDKSKTDFTGKVFAGYSLLEETTVLRFSFERYFPEDEEIVNTFMLQISFAMGPHKAHQF